MKNTLAFPGLGIPAFTVSETISVFGLSIHWYGVIIAVGILLAYLFASYKAKKRDVSSDSLLDIILWGLPSAVICARLYYVIFSFADYKDNLLDIFKIWEGGIAIYGAIIGACISSIIYCKVKKISIPKIFDLGAFGLLIGQAIGRWGNFVNAEAYGTLTNTALFRMELLDLGATVHPTFLYESLWNIFVFILLNLYDKHRKFDGEVFLLYLLSYGVGRFLIEGLRTDSLYLGGIRISQLVALLCIIASFVAIMYRRTKIKKEAENIQS